MRVLALVAAAFAAVSVAPAAGAAVAPVRWCGTDQATADRARDRLGGAQIHVIYAVPADGEDRLAALASGLATDIAAIDAWWRREDPTRAPRFDLFEFPGCESRLGLLDISFARLPQPAASLVRFERRFQTIAETLFTAPFNYSAPRKKYLVFYDGVVASDNVCGTAAGRPERGGDSFAVVYLRSSCEGSIGDGGGNALVAAHELIHMLGALPRGAPNACHDDIGHPCDSPLDILWPFLGVDLLDQVRLDVNRDDYYGHGGSWFDLQDSLWLLNPAAQAVLTHRVIGSGRIQSAPDVQSCSAVCATEWDTGSAVELRAVPARGYRFAGWSGACTGTAASCRVNVSGSAEAVARFGRARVLTLAIAGRGTLSARGVRCTRTCRLQRAEGERLTLRASATRGWRFVRWSGACRGTRLTCTVRVGAKTRAGAVFARR